MNSKDNISEGFKDLLGGINKELNNSAKATDNDTNKIDNTHQNISDPEKDTKNDIESSSETNGGTRVFDAVKKESTPVTTENSSNNLENSVSDKKRVDKPTEKNTENPVHPLHNRSLPKKTSVKTLGTREHLPAENKEGGNKMTPTKSSSSKKTKGNVKKGQRRGCLSGFLKFIVYISFVAVVSVLLGFYLISVGNDMFAFVKDTYDFSETVCSVKGDANNSFKITRTKLSGNKFTFDYKFDTPLSEDEKKSVDASIVLIDTKDNSVTMNYGKFSDFIRENKSISVDLSEANMTGSTYILKLTVNTANNASYITEFTVKKKVVDIKIEEDASSGEVAKQLKEKGIIEHPTVFSIYAGFKKNRSQGYYGKGYISGTHQLYPGMNYDDLIATLSPIASSRKIVKLTFPEGATVDEIIDILIKGGVENTREEYIEVINNYDFDYKFIEMLDNSTLPDGRVYRLEGYLFPDTYEFYTDASPATVINKFLANFNDKFNNLFYEEAQRQGLSVDDIIKIASMIELEAGTAEDRDIISSVFHNRLNSVNSASGTKFYYMQSDATTDYASVNLDSIFKLDDNNSTGNFSVNLANYNLIDADYYFNLNINTGKTRSVALIHLKKTTSNDGKPSYKITSQTVSNDAQTSSANDLTMSITSAEIKGTTLNCKVKLSHNISKDKFKDFKVNLNLFRTAYNTYLSTGLMPSAVSNPGYESITSALYPDSTNYYYFVADKYGKSHFSTTNEQHNKKINELTKNGSAAISN